MSGWGLVRRNQRRRIEKRLIGVFLVLHALFTALFYLLRLFPYIWLSAWLAIAMSQLRRPANVSVQKSTHDAPKQATSNEKKFSVETHLFHTPPIVPQLYNCGCAPFCIQKDDPSLQPQIYLSWNRYCNITNVDWLRVKIYWCRKINMLIKSIIHGEA